MSTFEWHGARWWKVDIHTHTPASVDYGKGPRQSMLKEMSPRDWLLDHMRAGVDCIGVTDHNSGRWIDPLKSALASLEDHPPDGYRPIHILPGVELTVHGNVHVLALFDSCTTTRDIDTLLGEVRYSGTPGCSDDCTENSFTQVVNSINRMGGLAIPAHVDGQRGLFEQTGNTLRQALTAAPVLAMELVGAQFSPPGLYNELRTIWTEIAGSDSHHPSGERSSASRFSWVKMGRPSLDGLRLALMDGALSVRRSVVYPDDPNQYAETRLEELTVRQSKYMGRSRDFRIGLSPWLNAITGGRGTGKSTLVEFLRIALNRTDELPESLQKDFAKYNRATADRQDEGLLTDDFAIEVVYVKGDHRYKIQYTPSGGHLIYELDTSGQWVPGVGDVNDRFPVRVYSQKQVFEMAKEPKALLRVIDSSTSVDHRTWQEEWNALESQYLSLRSQIREEESKLADEERHKGQLDDIIRRLAVFESAGQAQILVDYKRRGEENDELSTWEESWIDLPQRLRELLPDFEVDPLYSGCEVTDDDLQELEFKSREVVVDRLANIRLALTQLATEAEQVVKDWAWAKGQSSWGKLRAKSDEAYEALCERLSTEDAGTPSEYGPLVAQKKTVEEKLAGLQQVRSKVLQLMERANSKLDDMVGHRRELTQRRTQALAVVLRGNQFVRIQVRPYGDRDSLEPEFRELIDRVGSDFDRDLLGDNNDGLLASIHRDANSAGQIEANLNRLKHKLRQIHLGREGAEDVKDRRFAGHIQRLQPERLDRIDAWFPEDQLEVEYSTTDDGSRFRALREGSPGQRTAALLAFLFLHGTEPIILDQPEDDLDNGVISALIVKHLRQIKQNRQTIVVTHNANIVVNGDAELVMTFASRGGETQLDSTGSLQDRGVRESICSVLEGGWRRSKRGIDALRFSWIEPRSAGLAV